MTLKIESSTHSPLPALPLAENMPADALHSALEVAQITPTSELPSDRSRRAVRIGWLRSEIALSRDTDDSTAETMFTEAYASNDISLGDRQAYFSTYASASLLDIYLPTFEKHRGGQSYESERATVQRATASLLKESLQAPIHPAGFAEHFAQPEHSPCFNSEESRAGLTARLAGSLLLLRAGRMPLAASSRESSVQANDYHHYYLIEDGRKLPIRINSKTRATRPGFFTFAFRRCVGAASSKVKVLKNVDQDQLAIDMIEWLQRDAHRGTLTRLESSALKNATNHVNELLELYRNRTADHSGFGR